MAFGFPAYHEDREAAFPDALGPQWEDSADFFGAFGWTIAGSEDLEADDILNSYALKEEKAGGRALLMTGTPNHKGLIASSGAYA